MAQALCLLGFEVSVEEMTKLSLDTGCRAASGTDMNAFGRSVAKKYPVSVITSSSADAAMRALEGDSVVIANVGGDRSGYEGVFSTGGHYIVLAEVSDDDKVDVLDPGMYSGKYAKQARQCVKVTHCAAGDILTAEMSVIDKDCENRSPRYYIITRV